MIKLNIMYQCSWKFSLSELFFGAIGISNTLQIFVSKSFEGIAKSKPNFKNSTAKKACNGFPSINH